MNVFYKKMSMKINIDGRDIRSFFKRGMYVIRKENRVRLLFCSFGRKRIISISGLFLLSFFISCEKVIDIKINGADKKYVIEGNVFNVQSLPQEVKISQTKDFSDDNSFVGIRGALVSIREKGGLAYRLAEVSAGIYRTTALKGIPGRTYELSVTINGNSYTATSTMPSALVSIDSLSLFDIGFGSNTVKTIIPSYKDPPGLGNSYRIVEYANEIPVKKIFVQNDDLSDGLVISRPLINPKGELKTGDAVRVNLLCIDSDVYKYWFSLDQAATGDNQSATPTNPVSNISGGVLGYFSAQSISGINIVIP